MIFETKYRLQALLAWEKLNEEHRCSHDALQKPVEEAPERKELPSPLIMLFAAMFAWFTRN